MPVRLSKRFLHQLSELRSRCYHRGKNSPQNGLLHTHSSSAHTQTCTYTRTDPRSSHRPEARPGRLWNAENKRHLVGGHR